VTQSLAFDQQLLLTGVVTSACTSLLFTASLGSLLPPSVQNLQGPSVGYRCSIILLNGQLPCI
jgi:hypothetical protein